MRVARDSEQVWGIDWGVDGFSIGSGFGVKGRGLVRCAGWICVFIRGGVSW